MPVSEVAGCQHLRSARCHQLSCQFRKFAAALFKGPAHFLSPDRQSAIHCLIICAIQLLTPNNLGGARRRICSPDIRNVSALEVLLYRALQIDIYLLTYLPPAMRICSIYLAFGQYFCIMQLLSVLSKAIDDVSEIALWSSRCSADVSVDDVG